MWAGTESNVKAVSSSVGTFDDSGQNCQYEYMETNTGTPSLVNGAGQMIYLEALASSGNNEIATITRDATNIIISWTKNGTGAGAGAPIYLIWEVEGYV